MPALAFLAWVGLALVALLFVADAMLVDHGPAIVVSQRIGLPEQWHPDPDSAQTPTPNPIPTPEMTSQAVISNQPVSEAARAEALPKKKSGLPGSQQKRVTRQSTKRPQNYVQEKHVQQSSLFDRFSIRDQ